MLQKLQTYKTISDVLRTVAAAAENSKETQQSVM
jgi:hypothetical protein